MRVGIVEDQSILRSFLGKLIAEAGHNLVFEAASLMQAVPRISQLGIDLLILDLLLPDGDGFEVLRQMSIARHTSKVLIYSAHCDAYTVFLSELAQVDGFLDKEASTIPALKSAIANIEAGRLAFCDRFRAHRLSRILDPNAFSKILSDTEIRFVCLAGRGMTDDEISTRLQITKRTVQTHRSSVLRKLDLQNAAALVSYSVANGFSRFQTPVQLVRQFRSSSLDDAMSHAPVPTC